MYFILMNHFLDKSGFSLDIKVMLYCAPPFEKVTELCDKASGYFIPNFINKDLLWRIVRKCEITIPNKMLIFLVMYRTIC